VNTDTQVVHVIESLASERGRYSPQAYFFVLEALNYTLERLRKEGHAGHITGHQLLEGILDLGIKSFGFLGRAVFESWGLRRTGDFGDIVFDLVSVQLLSKQETDTKADFEGGFDFANAFEGRFLYEE
jgi:uncharacterized repeat protein (TIGR04138 family)